MIAKGEITSDVATVRRYQYPPTIFSIAEAFWAQPTKEIPVDGKSETMAELKSG